MSSLKFGVLTRSFSTCVTNSQLVKPKIQVFGTDGRYAMALYSAASKKKCLNNVEKDLKDLSSLMETDTRFREFMLNPLLHKELKAEAINSVTKKKNYNVLTANLLACMAENGRVSLIKGTTSAFLNIMAAERGEVSCEVTTAKALDAATQKELETILKTFLKKGETLNLSLKVDPSIIGGMLVSVGDKFVDMSIASKIKKYSDLLEQAV